MDKASLGSNIRKIIGQRNIFIALAAMMSLSTVILGLLLFSKSERIVIVPTSGPSLWVDQDKVSRKYLESMGTLLADLLLNRSPADSDWRNQEILKYVDPSCYHNLKRLLIEDAQKLKSSHKATVFRPDLSYADMQKMEFSVEGTSEVFVGKADQKLTHAQSVHRRYTLGFKCTSGRLHLTSIKQEAIND
jgi:type IV conjugative transfer system protein TraE